MTLTDKENALIEEMGHALIEKFLPEVIDAGVERLPDNIEGTLKMVWALVEPKLKAMALEKLEAKFAKAGA